MCESEQGHPVPGRGGSWLDVNREHGITFASLLFSPFRFLLFIYIVISAILYKVPNIIL